jgi:hypothetical protein
MCCVQLPHLFSLQCEAAPQSLPMTLTLFKVQDQYFVGNPQVCLV